MKPEDQRYYDELEDMFSSAGWKHFETYLQKVYNHHVQQGWQLSSGEKLLINKGVVSNLEQLSNFREEHQAAHTQLQKGDVPQ